MQDQCLTPLNTPLNRALLYLEEDNVTGKLLHISFPFDQPATQLTVLEQINSQRIQNFLVGKKIEILVSFFGEDAKYVWVTVKTVAHWEHLQFQYRRVVSSTPKSHPSSTDGIGFWIASCKASTLAFQRVTGSGSPFVCVLGKRALSTWTDWTGDHLSKETENSKKQTNKQTK